MSNTGVGSSSSGMRTRRVAVSIPVRGVKPQFDVENETYGWDEEPMYDDDVWEKSEAEK